MKVLFFSNMTYGNYSSILPSIGQAVYFMQKAQAVIGIRDSILDVCAGESQVNIFAIYPNDVTRVSFNSNSYAKKDKNMTAAEQYLQVYSLQQIRTQTAQQTHIEEVIWDNAHHMDEQIHSFLLTTIF